MANFRKLANISPMASRYWLFLVLSAAFALRAILVFKGGQEFFPDEARYLRSLEFVWLYHTHSLLDALRKFFLFVDHPGFVCFFLPPALIQYAVAHGDLNVVGKFQWIPALYNAGISTLILLLVKKITDGLVHDRLISFLATLFTGCSVALTFFCRHVTPYELSLLFCLLALYVWVKSSGPLGRWALSGLWLGLAYWTYNGALWFCVSLLVMISVKRLFVEEGRFFEKIGQLSLLAVSFAIVPAGTFAISLALYGDLFWRAWLKFVNSVSLGSYAEGPVFIFKYFWRVDSGVSIVLWLGVGFYGLYVLRHWQRQKTHPPVYLLGACLLFWGIIAINSAILEKFVMYGRIARMLIPLLAMLAALGWAALVKFVAAGRRSLYIASLGVLVAAQYAFGLYLPFTVMYPKEIIALLSPRFKLSLGYTLGPCDFNPTTAYHTEWALLNAAPIRYDFNCQYAPPPGTVIFKALHPFVFEGYLFEGRTPEQRAVIRATDIAIQLIHLKKPD